MNERPPTDELVDTERRRGNTYKLLAECFQTPDEELITLLEDVDAREVCLEIGELTDRISDDIESLRVEYAKLFVGPFEVLAPPYGSVYLDDEARVMTHSTLDVMHRYREVGLDTDLDEPADHVAVELEFVYALIFQEIEAINQSDHDAALEYRRRQREFLHTHLGRWVGEFTDKVETHAETEFYQILARETAAFVTEDVNSVSDRLEQFENETAGDLLWTDDKS